MVDTRTQKKWSSSLATAHYPSCLPAPSLSSMATSRAPCFNEFLMVCPRAGCLAQISVKNVKVTRIPKTKAGTTWWSVRLLHSQWTFAYKYTQCGWLDIKNNPDSHWLRFVDELRSTSYLWGVAHFFNGCHSTPTMLSSPATSPIRPNVPPNQPPVYIPACHHWFWAPSNYTQACQCHL